MVTEKNIINNLIHRLLNEKKLQGVYADGFIKVFRDGEYEYLLPEEVEVILDRK